MVKSVEEGDSAQLFLLPRKTGKNIVGESTSPDWGARGGERGGKVEIVTWYRGEKKGMHEFNFVWKKKKNQRIAEVLRKNI